MAVLDPERDAVVIRIVYDGPPHAGKTTSVRSLARSLSRSVETPLEAEGRTLFFDWMEYTGGLFEGHQIRCQIVSVPGQPDFAARRRALLETADVVVFVADTSDRGAVARSASHVREMVKILGALTGPPVGVVVQANKRDLPSAVPRDELAAAFGDDFRRAAITESVAEAGVGIRETFVLAVRLALDRIRELMARGELPRGTPAANSAEQLLKQLEDLQDEPVELAIPPPPPPIAVAADDDETVVFDLDERQRTVTKIDDAEVDDLDVEQLVEAANTDDAWTVDAPTSVTTRAPPSVTTHAGATEIRIYETRIAEARTAAAEPDAERPAPAPVVAARAPVADEIDFDAIDGGSIDGRGTPAGSAAEWQRGSIDDELGPIDDELGPTDDELDVNGPPLAADDVPRDTERVANGSASSRPRLPDARVPSGAIWPPVEGRLVLHEAATAGLILHKVGNADWIAGMGTGWRVHSSGTDTYQTFDDGRRALLSWARLHSTHADLLSPTRCVVLAEAGGHTWRLWQIVKLSPSLRTWVVDGAELDAGELFGRLATAAMLLGEAHARTAQTRLPATLDSIGRGLTGPQFVALMPTPHAGPPPRMSDITERIVRELSHLLAAELIERRIDLSSLVESTDGWRTPWDDLVATAIARD